MFSIEILTVGGLKKGTFAELGQEYLKRLSPYAKVKEQSVKDTAFRSTNEQKLVQTTEMNAILEGLNKDSFNILLSEHGKTFDSPTFAKQIEQWSEHGARPLTFIIAGPLGHDRALEKQVDALLSLSPLTFPHDMAHIILLEQLYRATTILNNTTYHY
jgi:23S rRNA (pseudouridine1915-N3)-methyltransferase